MAQNDFLVFANSSGADVEAQSSWVTDPVVANGMVTGQASSSKCNKSWRQGSVGSAVIASYITTILNSDVIDDGTTGTILSNLAQAIRLNGWAIDTSSIANVMTVTLDPAPIALTDGMIIAVKVGFSNTTSSSLQVNSFSSYPVVTSAGALNGGELLAGKVYQFIFLASTNEWLLLNYQTTCITPSIGDNSNNIATTAYVLNAGLAPILNPNLTGVPTSPTAPLNTNTTQIASTAFVQNALQSYLPSGTRLLFFNATAPTGWTQVTDISANNRMIRVVNISGGTTGLNGTGGGGYGGTESPITMTGAQVPGHTHTATSTVNDPGHNHTYTTKADTQPQSGSATDCWHGSSTATTSTSTTGITVSTSVGTNSSTTSWNPQYLNGVLASKD